MKIIRAIFRTSWYLVRMILITVIFLGIVAFAYHFGKLARPESSKIRNIGETQQQLIDAGYEWVIVDGNWAQVTVDYLWGPKTDAAYCQWSADRTISRMAGDRK